MHRISTARLCRLIGRWSDGNGALPDQLAGGITKLMVNRELPIGAVVPSERELAKALGVSRGTVSAAFTKLREVGVLDSRRGSGSRLISPVVNGSSSRSLAYARLAGEDDESPTFTDMSSGALDASPILRDVLREFTPAHLNAVTQGHGYHPAGLTELRWAIAQYYKEIGIDAHPDNVLITSGAQQAAWLIFNTLLNPGDTVLIEDPTYRGALEALRRCEAKLVGVPVRSHGIDLAALSERLVKDRPKMLYLFTEAQNPTGITLPQEQRLALAKLVNRHRVFVLEDSSQSELRFENDAGPTPIYPLIANENIATIGTLSKLFWGGLRLGWILASKATIKRLISAKAASDLGNSVIDQSIGVKLLERVVEARQFRRNEMRGYLDAAEHIIQTATEGWIWSRPDGGSALWIRLPGVDAVKICQQTQRRHLILPAGPGYSVAENFKDYIRIPFVRPLETFEGAVKMIAELTETVGPGSR